MSSRVGLGYDAHQLVEDRPLIIGGVHVPHARGAAGHSDADVLLHAIADALLGAVALGDIGAHFPDTDPAWKDADSRELLKQVTRLLAKKGWRPVNVDATVVLERPKLRPHVLAMRQNIAEAMGMDIGAVSVKASTNEAMGPVGRGEGIVAHAVVLVETVG